MKTKFVLPVGVLTQHLVAMGKTGAGKSSMLRHVVEHLLSENKRVVVIDPKGDWYGLKISADGKRPGFAVVAFGQFKSEKATDIPITPDSGKAVAELILKGNRPAIIGMRGWMPAEQAKFWVAFASTVFNSNYAGGLNVVIDEAQNFAPKELVGYGNENMALYWTKKLLSEGRGLGLTMFIGSQRPQSVHNGVLTQCETLVAMRLTHNADCSAVEAWLKRTNNKEVREKILTSIPEMSRGSAWVWSPEIKFGPEIVSFPMFETFDSFAPPQNQRVITAGGWSTVDLEDVKAEMQTVITEQKANDPAELKRQITELKKKLFAAENKTTPPEVRTVEVPVISEDDRSVLDGINQAFANWASEVESFRGDLKALTLAITQATAKRAPQPFEQAILRGVTTRKAVLKTQSVGPSTVPLKVVDVDGKLSVGERAILTAIVQRGDAGTEKTTLMVLAGYKSTSTGEYARSLVAKGFATKQGAAFFPTAEGVAALGDFEPLPAGGEELIEYWRGKLTGGELKIFETLIGAPQLPLQKDAICEATGYKATSCGEYLRQLIARQIVVRVGAGEYTLAENF